MPGLNSQPNMPLRARYALLLPVMLVMTLLALPASSQIKLPAMGESVEAFLSSEEEKKLGEAFMRNLRHSLTLVEDLQIEEYIQSLGQRVAVGHDAAQRDFNFFVVADPAINAFAGPGGYIGINSGLILATESEAELAAVIAHEIAHVTQRHLARAYQKASSMNLPLTAAVIAAIILGNHNSQIEQAAIASVAAGSVQQQINFTRSQESEADRIGLQILVHAGFDPAAMPDFFEKLLRASGYSEEGIYEFLRTHPMTYNRIAEARDRARQLASNVNQNDDYYAIMRARINVLTTTQDRTVAGSDYEQALKLSKDKNYPAARQLMQKLITKEPDKLSYQLALAEIDLAANQPLIAIKTLEQSLRLNPDHLPLILLYIRTLLTAEQIAQARQALQRYNTIIPRNRTYYELVAESEGKLGRASASHQALAEFYYLNGNTAEAINQLQLALASLTDKEQSMAEKIRSRLLQLKKEADSP